MTRIDADWLAQPDTQRVLTLLEDAGHAAYVVGGAVRNTLMDREVTDIDIATSALPDAVVRVGETAGFRAIPTGFDHGTVTWVVNGATYEITTFRRDVETDGRHAVVAFSTQLDDDARRRDFTINALYADKAGRVLDPTGGLPDLHARRIVFVGDPNDRIREDYLRSLRFFRFFAEYGDPAAGIDAEALAAIAAHTEGLDGLARERVGAEMRKLLSAGDPAPALAAMERSGVLMRVLPGASAAHVAPLVHLEGACGVAHDPMRRLAALGGEAPDERLRLSRQEARRLSAILRHLGSDATPAEIAWRDGAEMAWDVVLLRHAIMATEVPGDVTRQIEEGAAAVFPVSAEDLMPDWQGERLGKALELGRRLWIDSGFTLSREDVIAGLRKAG